MILLFVARDIPATIKLTNNKAIGIVRGESPVAGETFPGSCVFESTGSFGSVGCSGFSGSAGEGMGLLVMVTC